MSNRKTIVELIQAKGEWRWRLRDFHNHKIIGASTESYKRKVYALRNLQRVGRAYMFVVDDELMIHDRDVVEGA